MTDANPDLLRTKVTPTDYIRDNFQPSDRIAVLVRNAKRGETTQRISTADKIAAEQFQDWMRYKNDHDGSDIYVGMNALKTNAFTRTKHDVLAIRHLYADFDHDGSASLAAIEKSTLVPPANYVLNTSPDKYQAIWKVEGIELAHAETLLHALAREFDGDHAATDAARVLRLPGFLNKKYDPDFLVSARCLTDRIYHARDFKLRTESLDSSYRQFRQSSRAPNTGEPRPISQSERDWAHVKSALANGANPEELIAELAESRSADKSNPQYYARLTVTKALAALDLPPTESGSSVKTDSEGGQREAHR
jgi:RepB DNA-primase from phage plasmid